MAVPSSPVRAPVIAVVAFDRISPFHLSVPCVVFGDRHPGAPPFDLRVCTAERGPLSTTAGFALMVHHGLEAVDAADVVIVPSWRDPAERPCAALMASLIAAHRRGAQIVGLCLGAYVLAEAGLLDGLRATTHWSYARDFASRFPAVQLEPDVLYVDAGQVITSAGTAAGLDCCLHMLRARYGGDCANHVARRLVVPPHRQGGQAQFIEQPVPSGAHDTRLAGLMEWVRAHLDQPHDLESLSVRALMSRRTLTRRFRQLAGMSVGDWLARERLQLAQRMLEAGNLPVARIAELTGFGSVAAFRQQFRAALGVSPSAWRQTFRR